MWYWEIFVTSNRVCIIILFNFSISSVLVYTAYTWIFFMPNRYNYLLIGEFAPFLFDSTCIYFVFFTFNFVLYSFLFLFFLCITSVLYPFCFHTFASIGIVAAATQARQSLFPEPKRGSLLLCWHRASHRPGAAAAGGAWLRCCPGCLSPCLPEGPRRQSPTPDSD